MDYGSMFGGHGRDRTRQRSEVRHPITKPGNFGFLPKLESNGPRKSWTDQLLDSRAQNQHYGGGPAKTVRQQGIEADLVKRGFNKMPNPATLDPNDERLKFSKEYGYGTGGDIINMWDPRKMWVPGIASGSLKGPPIRQY